MSQNPGTREFLARAKIEQTPSMSRPQNAMRWEASTSTQTVEPQVVNETMSWLHDTPSCGLRRANKSSRDKRGNHKSPYPTVPASVLASLTLPSNALEHPKSAMHDHEGADKHHVPLKVDHSPSADDTRVVSNPQTNTTQPLQLESSNKENAERHMVGDHHHQPASLITVPSGLLATRTLLPFRCAGTNVT